MANKMQPTPVPVSDFLTTVSSARRAEAEQIIAIMHEISGEKPVMWGPSIIGFGTQHYKSEAGTEGDMGLLGFSPRKSNLTIYFYEGFDRYGEELAKLGKHTTSVGCLYVNKLADIDTGVLKDMLKKSYLHATAEATKPLGVDEYIEHVPQQARKIFDELRALVKHELPHAKEVVSYGIIGYKIDDKRARVFVSGWKDHVAVYPVPKDKALEQQLKPYIKGKGTLWFDLDQPLPTELLVATIKALAS